MKSLFPSKATGKFCIITFVNVSKLAKFAKYVSNETSYAHGALHYKRWSTHHLEETVVVKRM